MYLSKINYIKHVTDGQRRGKQLDWLCVTDGQTCIQAKLTILSMLQTDRDMKNNLIGLVWNRDRNVFKLNKQYLACGRWTDVENNLICYVWQTDRHVYKLNKLY